MFVGGKGNCRSAPFAGRGVAMSAIALTRGSLLSQGRRLTFTSSSLRTQGPITTDVCWWQRQLPQCPFRGPRRRDERNRAHAGVPAFAGTTANIHLVVPANAGTHNHRCLLVANATAAAPSGEAAAYGSLLAK